MSSFRGTAALTAIGFLTVSAHADINSWLTNQPIPNTQGITPGPGANLSGLSIPFADLTNTDLTNATLANADLTEDFFNHSTLTNSNFTNAVIQRDVFDFSTGLTFPQLASTASFQQKNLTGVSFGSLDLSGWNLSNQDLTSASFAFTNLAGANLTNANFANTTLEGADLRNVIGFSPAGVASANGTIFPDGTMPSLQLRAGDFLPYPDGQSITIRNISPAVRITDPAPTVIFSNLIIQGDLTSPDLFNCGTINQSAGNSTFGNITNVPGDGIILISGGHLTAASISAYQVLLSDTGRLTITPNATASVVSILGFAGSTNSWTGTLDLTSSALIVQPDPAFQRSVILTNVQNQVAFGRSHNAGVISSTLAPPFALAFLDNAFTHFTTFDDQPVDPTSMIIAPELLGDANADGHVDLTDLSIVLNNFGNATSAWTSGNFDGAGAIDLTDLSFVLNNFGLSNPNASNSAVSSPTPEPASLLFGAPLILLLKRRRR